MGKAPCAFLCHASEDKDIVRRVAQSFQSHGIETFFDEWEIGPGDSIREKIDAGLERCTHFIAILSPHSLQKRWVNAEMDGGFIRKLEGHCRFIPLRYGLTVSQLPPLFRGMSSPALDDYDSDIAKLINSIHDISQKPALGPPPNVVLSGSGRQLGLSPVAEAIVRLLAARSENGNDSDPMLEAAVFRAELSLPDEDLVEAVDELEDLGFVVKRVALGCGPIGFHALGPRARMFVEYDSYLMGWNPQEDAVRVAAELVNTGDSAVVSALAQSLGWAPPRMNPAVNCLLQHGVVNASNEIGSYPWCRRRISKNAKTRGYVRDRS